MMIFADPVPASKLVAPDTTNPALVRAYRRIRRIERLVPPSRRYDLKPAQAAGAIEDALCGALEGRLKDGGR